MALPPPGSAAATEALGLSWRNAAALGTLLSTRGLVELIVLNIAYKIGAFTPTLFTMMAVMAIMTTMCTTPILKLLEPKQAASGAELSRPAA